MTTLFTTYNESALHAALKEYVAEPGARFEVDVNGFVVDIVQADGLLVEVQTGNFTAIRAKLSTLVRRYPLRLVYPVAARKWIIRRDADTMEPISRRRSSSKGAACHLFYELVRMPYLLAQPNFTLEVLLIEEEEYRSYRQTRRRRRWRWQADERHLLQVFGRHLFTHPADLAALLPASLPDPFGTADLAEALHERRALAQKMVYCLRELSCLEIAGKAGNALLYRRVLS
jgi:hypothetical protein